MTRKRTVGRSRRFFGPPRIRGRFAVLEYRAPPGTQTIDNSEEFERVRRCAEQGILPYSRPRPSFWRSLRRSDGSRVKAVSHQHLEESDDPSADEHRR